MNRYKTMICLSALCALALSALTAASASAAPTTAGECKEGGGSLDFEDAHCDHATTAGAGKFGHVLFANNVKTEVTAINDLTAEKKAVTLEGKVAGLPTNIECTEANGTGSVTNEAGGKVKFGEATTEFKGCKVEDKPEKCKGTVVTVTNAVTTVTGPHNLKISETKKEGPTPEEKVTFHEENAAGTEMGLKFTPAGLNFSVLKFTEVCGLPEAVVRGFAYATPGRGGSAPSSGATAVFDKSSTIGGLTVAGTPAYFLATFTFRKKGGNPLILTTTE